MKLTKIREHTVNMGNYESLKIGATVEITDDWTTQGDYEAAVVAADKALAEALAADIAEARELTNVKDSYILSWGEGDK